MAQPKVVLGQQTYTCTAECLYRDKHFKVGDEVDMNEREAGFLVNSGKFKLKSADDEVIASAVKSDKEVAK